MKKILSRSQNRSVIFEALAPRVLFSADSVGPGVKGPGSVEEMMLESAEANTLLLRMSRQPAEFSGLPEGDVSEFDDSTVQEEPREVVFVDERVPGHEELLYDLLTSRDDDCELDVVLLERDRDGIEQISEILDAHSELSAVHLISHGCDGQLVLGSGQLDLESLLADEGAIGGWRHALSEDAEFLLYGCDLVSSSEGQGLVNALAKLTGADVAASADPRGTGQKCAGHRELESETGGIETTVALSAPARSR